MICDRIIVSKAYISTLVLYHCFHCLKPAPAIDCCTCILVLYDITQSADVLYTLSRCRPANLGTVTRRKFGPQRVFGYSVRTERSESV